MIKSIIYRSIVTGSLACALSVNSAMAEESRAISSITIEAGEKAGSAVKKAEKKLEKEGGAKVQIAILLDSSTSMNGLLNQARAQLWDVVNTFINAEVEGEVPFVEVALFTHGQGLSGKRGDYIRMIQSFTRDLDKVSEELFALQTTGSKEYCGAVISRSLQELDWDTNPKTYKAIFIAGNESFRQGQVNADSACSMALEKGIIVNTIFCGDERAGIDGGWAAGAKLGEGKFSVINQDQATVQIEAPQDKKILELNIKLNGTYFSYHQKGQMGKQRQQLEDTKNAKLSKNGAVNRARTKASANYSNDSWDLLDAHKRGKVSWKAVKSEFLPKELRGKSEKEKEAWVQQKSVERTQIQKEIAMLGVERSAFIEAKRKELAKGVGDSLDAVIKNMVREQAREKGYTFK